jgi:dienelactone hydrolase
MIVPNTPDLFDDQVDGPIGGASVPRRGVPDSSPIRSGPLTTPRPLTPDSEASSGKLWGGGLGILGFILLVILKIAIRVPFRGNQAPARAVQPPQAIRQQPFFRQPFERPAPVNLSAPIAMPKSFPDLGPAQEIEPGVSFREIRLHPDPATKPPAPGSSGTLWLYLPTAKAGQTAPKSLPCVLMAPAGSNLITGMKLAVGDKPEHIPYVKAGFAVLAFDLDGAESNGRRGAPPLPNMLAFLRARAGLVNGRIAIEFLKAKVPEIDPGRLYVAGHSSAATFALLLAEHEPTLKGCVAYAPVVDLADHVRKLGMAPFLERTGFTELTTTLSPKTRESDLNCPLFVFQARDDETVDVDQNLAFVDRLKLIGKPVTLDLVNNGGHYQAMIDVGIPAGVAWLKSRDAEVKAKK